MDSILGFVEKYLAPGLTKFGEEKHMVGIQKGIVFTVPFTIIGSIFLIISSLPIPGWSDLIAPFQAKLLVPVSITFDMLAVIAAVGIGYSLAKEYKQDPVLGALFSLIGFFALQLTPEYSLDTSYFGAKGLFTAIIVSIYCIEVQKFFVKRNLIINLPDNVPPAVSDSFAGLLPLGFILITLWFVRVVLNFNINSAINYLFQPLVFALNTLPGLLVFMLIRSLLWCVGIHGGAVLSPISSPIFLQFLAINTEAFLSGNPVPYATAVGMLEFFVFIGGGGATLGLVLLMLRSKDEGFRTLGKVSLPSSIFEINEPVVFGAPIVLNPPFMIAYTVANLVLTASTYILMTLNIIGKPVAAVPWTMPPIIGAYLVTGGDWRAAVWNAISLVLSVVIYYPFFKIVEKQRLSEVDPKEIGTKM
jgi:PTS system cellobiose-specific IIC component